MSQKSFSGAKLRELRRALGVSPTALAYEINRSYNSIRAYESGSVHPPAEVIQHIADVLNLPVEALYIEVPDA